MKGNESPLNRVTHFFVIRKTRIKELYTPYLAFLYYRIISVGERKF